MLELERLRAQIAEHESALVVRQLELVLAWSRARQNSFDFLNSFIGSLRNELAQLENVDPEDRFAFGWNRIPTTEAGA